MLSKSEERKLEEKTRQYEEAVRPFNRWWKGAVKEIKLDVKNIFDWYFFFQPKDTTEKIWHFICIVIIDVALLRLFGLI